jgi:hypothetical protein
VEIRLINRLHTLGYQVHIEHDSSGVDDVFSLLSV